MDNAAIRYMFTSLLRGELQLANLTLQVTQNPMFAIRQGSIVEVSTYIIQKPTKWSLQISEGPWESLVRFYPPDNFYVFRTYFDERGPSLLREINRYKGWIQ